jgi:hypothetical protein
MDVNYTLVAQKLLRIIEMTKAKNINHRCLLVHNINEAGDSMVHQLSVFRYTIGISNDNLFQGFILPQAVASLATPIKFSLAQARVGREDKGILACAIVPGQRHKSVKGKRIGRMSLLALWE